MEDLGAFPDESQFIDALGWVAVKELNSTYQNTGIQ